jgi:hypothetical protein
MEFIVATEQPPRVIPGASGRRANRDGERIQLVGLRHALNVELGRGGATACGLNAERLYPSDLAWVSGSDSCPLCVIAVEASAEDD